MSTARMPGRRSHVIVEPGPDVVLDCDARRDEVRARLAVVNAEFRLGNIEMLAYAAVVIAAVVASAFFPERWF